jgi:hypothetical protein
VFKSKRHQQVAQPAPYWACNFAPANACGIPDNPLNAFATQMFVVREGPMWLSNITQALG